MRNKFHWNYLILITLIYISTSCSEIINIDLNSSDPQIVVEGNVSTNEQPTVVKISQSVNFSESNEFPKIGNAEVEIYDEEGNRYILHESESGIYKTDKIAGIVGKTYRMKVVTGGKEITAQSTVPPLVKFDSLTIKKSTEKFAPEKYYEVKVEFVDPVNVKNYYMFIEIVNDEVKRHYILDDRLSDGSKRGTFLRRHDREYEIGDKVQIIMQCIDENVYKYFSSLGYFTGGNPTSSSTPANPVTNLNGAILGYFSAHTYEMKEITITEEN